MGGRDESVEFRVGDNAADPDAGQEEEVLYVVVPVSRSVPEEFAEFVVERCPVVLVGLAVVAPVLRIHPLAVAAHASAAIARYEFSCFQSIRVPRGACDDGESAAAPSLLFIGGGVGRRAWVVSGASVD